MLAARKQLLRDDRLGDDDGLSYQIPYLLYCYIGSYDGNSFRVVGSGISGFNFPRQNSRPRLAQREDLAPRADDAAAALQDPVWRSLADGECHGAFGAGALGTQKYSPALLNSLEYPL